MLKKADIIREFMGAGSNSCQDIQHSGIHFSGISLSGYRIAGFESHFLSDHRIDLVNSLLISVKKLQEAGLGSCGSFRAQKFHSAEHIIQIF